MKQCGLTAGALIRDKKRNTDRRENVCMDGDMKAVSPGANDLWI